MIGEAALAVLLFWIGYGALVVLGPVGAPRSVMVWGSYPIGVAVWMILSTAVLVVRVPYEPRALLLILVALTVVATYVVARRDPNRAAWRDLRPLLTGAALVALVTTLASAMNLSAMTNDAFWMIRQAQALVVAGDVHSAPADVLVLRSFPIAVALLHTLADLVGRDYLVSQPTVLSITGLGLLAVLLFHGLRLLGVPAVRARTNLIITALFVSTTYFIVFQMFYIRGNLEAGVYTGLAIIAVWLATLTRSSGWDLMVAVAIVSSILLRVESPLFLVPVVGVVVATSGVPRSTRLTALSAYGVTVLGWYGTVLFPFGEGTIMDPRSLVVVLLTVPGLAVVYLLVDWGLPLADRLERHVGTLITVGLVAVAAAVTVWKPDWMQQAFTNVFRNTFEPAQGLWGVTWLVLVPLFLYAAWRPIIPQARLFTVPIVSYFVLLYASAAFSSIPHKLGWASSANRMLSVISISMVLYVVLHFAMVRNDELEAQDLGGAA